jgi:hypothetical protein
MAMQTLGGKLAAANNRPSGFDYIRITLAVSLVAGASRQAARASAISRMGRL